MSSAKKQRISDRPRSFLLPYFFLLFETVLSWLPIRIHDYYFLPSFESRGFLVVNILAVNDVLFGSMWILFGAYGMPYLPHSEQALLGHLIYVASRVGKDECPEGTAILTAERVF